jgi:hypothetical protein
MQIVPLQPIANQSVQVQLGDQACTLGIQQLAYGLFMTVTVGGALIIAGVICENRNRIVRSAYLGFSGDLAFEDTQGAADPVYTGLGTRFLLAWLEPADLAG